VPEVPKVVKNKAAKLQKRPFPSNLENGLFFYPNSSATQSSIFLVSLEKFTPTPITFLPMWYWILLEHKDRDVLILSQA
jgi:hypothetical protein